MSIFMRLAVTLVTGSMSLAGLSGCRSGNTFADKCVSVIRYDGHTYIGQGELKRDPEVTGRSMPAVMPGCHDSGVQSEDEKDEAVRVKELAGVAPGTAVLWVGSIFIRDGRLLPKKTERWFHAPPCDTAGTFAVTGDWLGSTGPNQARFDGDIRPPYRLEVHVTSGPSQYAGATIMVRATKATDPALGPADVKGSLWQGGQVSASVRCVDRHFEALALHT